MENHLNYSRVAEILLLQEKPIDIEALSVLAEISKDDLKKILDFFSGESFLENGKDYSKIILTPKAKS